MITIDYICIYQSAIDKMQQSVLNAIKLLDFKTNEEVLQNLEMLAKVAIGCNKQNSIVFEKPFHYFIIGEKLHFVSYNVINLVLNGQYTLSDNSMLVAAIMEYQT
jgi:hypothetical protein